MRAGEVQSRSGAELWFGWTPGRFCALRGWSACAAPRWYNMRCLLTRVRDPVLDCITGNDGDKVAQAGATGKET
jgi:hypothetical protein